MSSATVHPSRPGLALAVILTLALALRFFWVTDQHLWYDEMQSATMSALPLLDCVRSVKYFDPHPPLYYIQLHFWMLAGMGDPWIKLNSVFWSLAGILTIYLLARKFFTERVALLSAAFLALSPFAIEQAQNVRMYGMMMVLFPFAWWVTHRYLAGGRKLGDAVGIVLLSLAMLYTQGAAFIAVFALWTYAALFVWRQKPPAWRSLLPYAALQVLILVAYIPWVLRARNIRLGYLLVPGFSDVIGTLHHLYWGFPCPDQPLWWTLLGLAVLLIAVLWAFRAHPARTMAIALVIVPVLATILLSYLVRPVWIYRAMAFMTPFLCVFLAGVADRLGGGGGGVWKTGWRIILAAAFVFTAVLVTSKREGCGPYRPGEAGAIEYVEAHAQPGDLVYTPGRDMFWGLCWYAIGPGSFSPVRDTYDITTADGVRLLFDVEQPREAMARAKGTWVIYHVGKYQDADELGELKLARQFDRTRAEYRVLQR